MYITRDVFIDPNYKSLGVNSAMIDIRERKKTANLAMTDIRERKKARKKKVNFLLN